MYYVDCVAFAKLVLSRFLVPPLEKRAKPLRLICQRMLWVKNIFPIYAHTRLIQTPSLSSLVVALLFSVSATPDLCVGAVRFSSLSLFCRGSDVFT